MFVGRWPYQNLLAPKFFQQKFHIPYCPNQAPMGTAAQAPKIEGGWLHGEVAWMVQLTPCKGPPRMRSKLPGCTELSLRASLRPARCGESCIVLQSWPTRSLVAKFPQRSVIPCSKQIFVLQDKNTANEATDVCVQTFDAWCGGIQSTITAMWAHRIYHWIRCTRI